MKELCHTFLILLFYHLTSIEAKICSSNVDCPNDYECEDGNCTNVFEMGCLQVMEKRNNIKSGTYVKPRVCNSDDKGKEDKCRKQEFNYTEVRISLQPWDEAISIGWIYQIILSEVIGVPATMETGNVGTNAKYSFYDRDFRYGYPDRENPMVDLDVAHTNGGNCQLPTEPCAHIIPCVRSEGLIDAKPFQEKGSVFPEENNGVSGGFGLYIPLYTAKRDITLLDYQGLQGEDNRKKLAERFLSPTTFSDYCTIYATNNCTESDETVTRKPNSEEEGKKFFVDGVYNGYFRKADSNDCDKYPTTCTGHTIIPTCDRPTFTEIQFHWNEIALSGPGSDFQNRGYSLDDMEDIFKAGVKTESDMIIWWYEPDVMPLLYENTPSALQRVSLPRPTQECLDYRRQHIVDKCSEVPEIRLGNESIGSCDHRYERSQRLYSTSLETMKNFTDLLTRNPAMDYIKQILIPQYGAYELLSVWAHLKQNNTMNFEREAVCRYVYDNIEIFDLGHPKGYPVNLVVYDNQILSNMGVIFGVIGLFLSTLTFALLIKWKNNKHLKDAHSHMLRYIIGGFALISIAAIFGSLVPSKWSCVMTQWFQSIGYTIEFSSVCILASMMKINTNHSGNTTSIKIYFIFFQVTIIFLILYLAIWTGVDAPRSKISYKIDPLEEENLLSLTTCVCNSNIWEIALLGWETLLFLLTIWFTLKSKNTFYEWNQGKNLITMLKVQFFFLSFRILCIALHVTARTRSLIAFKWISIFLGIDTIVSIILYFIPLLFSLCTYQEPIEEEDKLNEVEN